MFFITYKRYLIRYFLDQRNFFYKTLFLSCAFSIALVGFRVFYTGESMFLFLIWNLFLAYLPFVLSGFIDRLSLQMPKKYVLVLMAVWLLLIPNSFYIITDLFHLNKVEVVPLWYDLALITSFAWNGLVMGILSVRQIERRLVERWKWMNEYCFIVPVMFLNAFGIYIGRYLRFNSWDVLMNPLQLVQDVVYIVVHPFQHRFDWSMIVCFTIMLSLFYLTVKGLSSNIAK